MGERLSKAATRGAVIAMIMFLFAVWRGGIRLEVPPSKRLIIMICILFIAWIMLTIWQMRSRLERWPWMSVLVGYVFCLLVLVLVSYGCVRLGFRL
jgi:hypothetical protein